MQVYREQIKSLGNPELVADADRAIANAGENFQVTIDGADGMPTRAKPEALLAEADRKASAAGELFECLGFQVRNPEISPIAGARLTPFLKPEGGG